MNLIQSGGDCQIPPDNHSPAEKRLAQPICLPEFLKY